MEDEQIRGIVRREGENTSPGDGVALFLNALAITLANLEHFSPEGKNG